VGREEKKSLKRREGVYEFITESIYGATTNWTETIHLITESPH
jgi:hypothetical protein